MNCHFCLFPPATALAYHRARPEIHFGVSIVPGRFVGVGRTIRGKFFRPGTRCAGTRRVVSPLGCWIFHRIAAAVPPLEKGRPGDFTEWILLGRLKAAIRRVQ